jgi:hypothetical protein
MLTVPKLAHQPQSKKTITAPPSLPQNFSSDCLKPIRNLQGEKVPKERIQSPNLMRGKENFPITKNDVRFFISPPNNNDKLIKNHQ